MNYSETNISVLYKTGYYTRKVGIYYNTEISPLECYPEGVVKSLKLDDKTYTGPFYVDNKPVLYDLISKYKIFKSCNTIKFLLKN